MALVAGRTLPPLSRGNATWMASECVVPWSVDGLLPRGSREEVKKGTPDCSPTYWPCGESGHRFSRPVLLSDERRRSDEY